MPEALTWEEIAPHGLALIADDVATEGAIGGKRCDPGRYARGYRARWRRGGSETAGERDEGLWSSLRTLVASMTVRLPRRGVLAAT